MLELTDKERIAFNGLPEGSYYGQIGITIRFGNHFWHECSGSLLAGACGGDNLPTLLKVRRKHGGGSVCEGEKHQMQKKSIAVLDRCGNNWKNGKGGCGILMHDEYSPCCATMFQPFVLQSDKRKEE